MQTILLSGSNGFIATNFITKFAGTYKFIKLSRKSMPGHITFEELATNGELAKSIDVVINLAGANIGDKRWSIARKKELLISRLKTTSQLVTIFNQAGARAHFISASAVGVYPPNAQNDEDTPTICEDATNFSEQLTRQWESAARKYKGKLTITRFGVVLGSSGGAFPKMLKPFLLYMGGPLGNGLQNFPWISLVDLLNALNYIINTGNVGIYNLVAPQIISNNQLAKTIAATWHKPCIFRIPESLIRLIFGQMGQELFLNSLSVVPTRLIKENFNYQHSYIELCLKAIKTKVF
ncbi:MAG: hypothetical protein K0R14_1165 [Burkholderiales bacterium]|jgi:uncharacterized protein (TIGR01777 family)|nr:hypothetical protein [Burkholderiales bacterium]